MPPGPGDTDRGSWRRDRVDEIAGGEAPSIPFERAEVPRRIQIAAVAKRPRDSCRLRIDRFVLHDRLAPTHVMRHVARVGHRAPARPTELCLFELQHELSGARLHA